REEKKVIEEFGEEYLKYKRNVPAFLPMKGKWKQFIQRSGNTVNKLD
ncbi:MAG TPA: isoprenylcysteine carboxyl methyltransferase, partial [Balneolaceae bacterium]|nr:isoprenylcysteine carboxyl methyltransferase [Balneolaceae bacterium]